MRFVPAILAVLCAACGGGGDDDGAGHADGAPAADGSSIDDIDGAAGGHADGATSDAGGESAVYRVWIVGDVLTDNRREAVGFPSDATLPFDPGGASAIELPGGSAELFDGTGSTSLVFDAVGDEIVYVADRTTPGQFDLEVASADGGGPDVLVAGQAGVEITSVRLSPDGSRVAFLMDADVDGGYDLHVVTTDGVGSPVKLSPDRPDTELTPANLDVAPDFEWSRDSTLIAFAGDLTENAFDQAYVVDATDASPVAVEILTRADIATQASGAQGVRGKLLFDASSDIYFRARVSTANNSQFTFFKSDTAGAKTPIETPVRGDDSVSDIGAFGITPDGGTLVFSADSPALGTYDLFAQDIANPQAPTHLTDLTPIVGAVLHAEFTVPLFFSPDGTRVAVVANYLSGLANEVEPFVIAVDGSGMQRLFDIPDTCTNCDTDRLAWTGDRVYAQGDLATNNDTSVFDLDPDVVDQDLVTALAPPMNGDVAHLLTVGP